MTARLIVLLSCKVNKYLSKFRWSQLYCQLKKLMNFLTGKKEKQCFIITTTISNLS